MHTRCCIFLSKQQFACELEKEKRCRAKEGGITEWMSFRRANLLLRHGVKIWVNRIICSIGESEGYAVYSAAVSVSLMTCHRSVVELEIES